MASTAIFTFEEQTNTRELAASGAVKYEVLGDYDDLNGTPAPALSTSRFFMIDPDPSALGAIYETQGPELNDLCVNMALFKDKYLVDFQIHETAGRARLTLAFGDTVMVAGRCPRLKQCRFRGWEPIIPVDYSGTTSDFLDWDQAPFLDPEDRDTMPYHVGQFTQIPIIIGVTPLPAGDLALIAHRLCSRAARSFAVTCEFCFDGTSLRLP